MRSVESHGQIVTVIHDQGWWSDKLWVRLIRLWPLSSWYVSFKVLLWSFLAVLHIWIACCHTFPVVSSKEGSDDCVLLAVEISVWSLLEIVITGRGAPLRMVLGKSKMIAGWEEGLPTILKGETAMVLTASSSHSQVLLEHSSFLFYH